MPPGDPPRYNATVEALRDVEYPMIRDSVYLDHAGTTLYPKSLLDRFTSDMAANLYGNPHSASASSQLSTSRIEDVRLRALQWFSASPEDFDLVFVANATAGIKLVSDSFRARPGGFRYLYHQASHTSIVGLREEAHSSACLDDGSVETLLAGQNPHPDKAAGASATLFAYTAQSNLDGRRFPLDWANRLRRTRSADQGPVFTLLDAASFVSTAPLNLGDSATAPDFVVLSFYKMFGFPDLGALIVRRQAWPAFESRRYFGGGTVDIVVSVKEQWHAPKAQFLHERLEDGTLPVHSIIALDSAMEVHRRLFGPMSSVASHSAFLTQRLYTGLHSLKHGSGVPVCTLYSPDPRDQSDSGAGPIVAFNVRTAAGAWLSLVEFEKLATLHHIHVRTGGVCNPGGVAAALSLEPWEIRRNFSAGFRCGTDMDDVMAGKPTGVVRASLGAMSTIADVDTFVAFVAEFFCDERVPIPIRTKPSPVTRKPKAGPELFVDSLMVYPIKSCGGYSIPKGTKWAVRPEGLAWDREWCLVHRGSGQALSQKRYPKMALIKPVVDFKSGELKVRYAGEPPPGLAEEISVPLSQKPADFRPSSSPATSSRVCGEDVAALTYLSEAVNAFFTDAIGVPCVLARFPPGRQAKRHSKARIQKHQRTSGRLTGSAALPSPPPPSPPDSDMETPEPHPKPILLSNESPILAINLASVRAINEAIKTRKGGGQGLVEVGPSAFRANVVVGGAADESAYSEDDWKTLNIGSWTYPMLGACRRCQMVCIDQSTGARSDEPFSTLSKVRRFEGKVFFGVHMGLASMVSEACGSVTECPAIQVGDAVVVVE